MLSEKDKLYLISQGYTLPDDDSPVAPKREEKRSEEDWLTWAGQRGGSSIAKGLSSDLIQTAALPVIGAKTVYNRAVNSDSWGEALKTAAIPDGGAAIQADIQNAQKAYLASNPAATTEQLQNFTHDYIQSDDYYHKTQESLTAPLRWAAQIEEGIGNLVGETRKPDQLTSGDELTELAMQAGIGITTRGALGAAKVPAAISGKIAKYALKAAELATPFTVPYSAGNVAANFGVGAAINQGVRYATDQETVLDSAKDAAVGVGAGAGAVGLAAILGKPGTITQVAKGITRQGEKEIIDIPAGAAGGAQTVVKDIGPQGIPGLASRATAKVKEGLDAEAPVRAAARQVTKEADAPQDVDDLVASGHGASFFKRVKTQADDWVNEPVRNFQRLSKEEQAAWDEYANLNVAVARRTEAYREADNAFLDAGTAFRRAPTKANLEAYTEAATRRQAFIDDAPETRLVMPQYTTREAKQAIADISTKMPKLMQHLNVVDQTTKRILAERVAKGIDDPTSAQNLNRFFYYGRQWQDDNFKRGIFDRAMRGEKTQSPQYQALSRDARRANTNEVENMISQPGASMEALVQYAHHSASVIERNATNIAVMNRLGLTPKTRRDVGEIDPSKHIVTFANGKEQVWEVPEGLAKGLNLVADNLSMAEKVMQIPRVMLQKGFTGAWAGPAALAKQLIWSMPSAMSLARAGSGVTPVTVARGMVRSAIAGEPVHHMLGDMISDARNILIRTDTGKRLIEALGGDVKKWDDWMWSSSQNMKRVMLEDAMTLGLDPESLLGHTVEKMAGLRARMDEVTGSTAGSAVRLATAPIIYPLRAWSHFFETLQSSSRIGIIAQEMAKARAQYGADIPKGVLAKIELMARESEGDLIRMSGSRSMRFMQRTVPYARVQMAGIALASKRMRAALGLDPKVKPFSADHFDAFGRVMVLGVAPAVAAAYLASRSPGVANYYWNVMPRYERERNMLFPDPAHPEFFKNLQEFYNGEMMDYDPTKFMKMPIPPDFGFLSSAMIQSMPAFGLVPAGTVQQNPTAWDIMRNTLADTIGDFVPSAVQLGASLFGTKINLGDAISDGTNPFRGGQQSNRIDPGATSGHSALEELPYVGMTGAAAGQRIRDIAMALMGTAGMQFVESAETGSAVAAAARKAGDGKDKWAPLKQGVEGFIDEYWQQQMDKMPDGPGVWSLTERVKTYNEYSKYLRKSQAQLREAGQYYTEVAGNPSSRTEGVIRDPLTQQIIGQLNKQLSGNTPYGQLSKQMQMLEKQVDLVKSEEKRATISPKDRAAMTNNTARQLLIAQMQQKELLDKNVEHIQQLYGEPFKQQFGVPLTLENLAAVSRRLLIGKSPQQ